MPGKPAARLTDSTAHGGLISGPGCPTVLIGKMPAACLGDMHVCPMMTPGVPPIPHVGGPITLGSTGVMIGKKPAARMGDMAVCVGPPSSVIKGEMTVMIGEAGSGSQAGSAGTAAAAAKASTKGPNSVNALEIVQNEAEVTEIHTVEIEFVDSAGNPMAGVPFDWKDPNGAERIGYSSPKGTWFSGGYPEAGNFEISVRSISQVKWSGDPEIDKAITLSAKANGFADGTPASFWVYKKDDANPSQELLATVSAKVSGEKIEAKWNLDDGILEKMTDASISGLSKLKFHAMAGYQIGISEAKDLKIDMPMGPCIHASFNGEWFNPDSSLLLPAKLADLGTLLPHLQRTHEKVLIFVNHAMEEDSKAAEALALSREQSLGYFLSNDQMGWVEQFTSKKWGLTELQTLLAFFQSNDGSPYYYMEIDGKSGPGTKQAIKDFQTDQSLDVDGIAGKQTYSALWQACQNLVGEINQKNIVTMGLALGEEATSAIEIFLWQSLISVNEEEFSSDKAASYQKLTESIFLEIGSEDPGPGFMYSF